MACAANTKIHFRVFSSPYLAITPNSPQSNPREPLIYFPSLQMCQFWTFGVNGISLLSFMTGFFQHRIFKAQGRSSLCQGFIAWHCPTMSPCAEVQLYPSLAGGRTFGLSRLPGWEEWHGGDIPVHPPPRPRAHVPSVCWRPFLGVERWRGTARLPSVHSRRVWRSSLSTSVLTPAVTHPLGRAILVGTRWHGPGFDRHCPVARLWTIFKCKPLVTCLPKHVAFFDDIASRIVFLISLLVCSLLQNRNAVDFHLDLVASSLACYCCMCVFSRIFSVGGHVVCKQT